jgi:hypothetical protein
VHALLLRSRPGDRWRNGNHYQAERLLRMLAEAEDARALTILAERHYARARGIEAR